MAQGEATGEEIMKTKLKKIKAQLREIIRLGELATPGPWHYWDQPSNDLIATGKDKGHLICGLAGLVSRPKDFAFIATSRNITPLAAKGLLDLIAYVEEDLAYPALNLRATERLETIRQLFTTN